MNCDIIGLGNGLVPDRQLNQCLFIVNWTYRIDFKEICGNFLVPNRQQNQCSFVVNWTYRRIDFKEIWIKTHFLSRKYIWKCHLQNVSHFVQASMIEDAMNRADWVSINLIHAQSWQLEWSAIYSSNNLPKKFSPEQNGQQFVLQMAFSNASGWKTVLVLKFYWNLFL